MVAASHDAHQHELCALLANAACPAWLVAIGYSLCRPVGGCTGNWAHSRNRAFSLLQFYLAHSSISNLLSDQRRAGNGKGVASRGAVPVDMRLFGRHWSC